EFVVSPRRPITRSGSAVASGPRRKETRAGLTWLPRLLHEYQEVYSVYRLGMETTRTIDTEASAILAAKELSQLVQTGQSRQRVAILGAGPAGLGAAWQLARQHKADVVVIEQRDDVGGNAGSFEIEGIPVDYGSHRLHSACAPEILDDLKTL